MTTAGTEHELHDDVARAALRERCLGLVRRWQPLARSGWDHQAARQLGEELDQITTISERLDLPAVNGSALELAAYLCSFVDDQLVPNDNDLGRLAGMVNALGAALGELAGTSRASVSALHVPAADATLPATAPGPAGERLRENRLHLPRATCLLGEAAHAAPGLSSALRERGYQVNEFDDVNALVRFLDVATPGALLLDARALRHLGRLRACLAAADADVQAMPALFVFSARGDLGDRLLAMRAGAAGLFTAPVDSLRVIARIDETLMHTTQTPWRVLLAETDKVGATERARWLAERGMTVRLASNGQGALGALGDFHPDVVIVDQELSDVHGLELVQLIRGQPEHAALPILMMSSSGDIGQRFDAVAAGCDDVLLKPVRARHLGHALVSRLQRARWLRDLVGAWLRKSIPHSIDARCSRRTRPRRFDARSYGIYWFDCREH
ncbi:MAG: response regulator transcription factor, partial [Xanthomonadales bacterium]|nr:response regulator transcription factor [Xanthomonadales bacterium]